MSLKKNSLRAFKQITNLGNLLPLQKLFRSRKAILLKQIHNFLSYFVSALVSLVCGKFPQMKISMHIVFIFFVFKHTYQEKWPKTANGPVGLNVQNHVEQANNLEVFDSMHKMGAKYALDYHTGTVTPSPVSTIKILYLVLNIQIKSNSPIANP